MKITFALLLMASAALTAKASLIPSSAASVDLDEVDTIKRLTERGQVLLVAQCLKGIKQRSLSLKRGILCRALIQSFVLKHQQTEPEMLMTDSFKAVVTDLIGFLITFLIWIYFYRPMLMRNRISFKH